MANCLYCLLYGTLTLSCAYVCKVFKSLFIFKLALLFTFLVLFLLLLLYFSSTFCVVFYFMLCLSFTPFHENQINHFTVCSVILVFDHYQFFTIILLVFIRFFAFLSSMYHFSNRTDFACYILRIENPRFTRKTPRIKWKINEMFCGGKNICL